jgi:hypothetical protein
MFLPNEGAMFTKHDLPGNDVASAEGESRDHRRGREIAVMWMVFFCPAGFLLVAFHGIQW